MNQHEPPQPEPTPFETVLAFEADLASIEALDVAAYRASHERLRKPARRARAPRYVADAPTLSQVAPRPRPIRGPEDVTAVLPWMAGECREHFVALHLNGRHEVTATHVVSIGSLNASIVHPREVFRQAIIDCAASVVLVHNHPSGDPHPSDEDVNITKRLAKVGELLGITVLDHVIIGQRGVVSLRQRRVL